MSTKMNYTAPDQNTPLLVGAVMRAHLFWHRKQYGGWLVTSDPEVKLNAKLKCVSENICGSTQ